MSEQRDNSGVLFKNDKKSKDTHPDRKGWATIGGVEYWISAWIKEGSKGSFVSLAFEPKEQRREAPKRGPSKPQDNDDLPF